MFSPLRNRFGIPGVISVIALVFAMFGGAYAASNSSNGGKATASAKAKQGPRGPRGKTGPAGPAGPAGAQGPAGAKGDKGDGGSAGASGKSAEAVSFTGSKTIGTVTCTEGGLEVKSASGTTLVCNGKKGTNGTNGQTGFTKTLPGGETETGAWAFGEVAAGAVPAGFAPLSMPISFNIPLVAPLGATEVHYINAAGKEVTSSGTVEVTSTACLGSATNPTAKPGNLCVYTGSIEEAKGSSEQVRALDSGAAGASTAGAYLRIFGVKAEASGFGAWAVTAEEE